MKIVFLDPDAPEFLKSIRGTTLTHTTPDTDACYVDIKPCCTDHLHTESTHKHNHTPVVHGQDAPDTHLPKQASIYTDTPPKEPCPTDTHSQSVEDQDSHNTYSPPLPNAEAELVNQTWA